MEGNDSVTVVGSIGIDDIETPRGKHESVLGGSATHFACAARFFSPVTVVGCVGEDMPPDLLKALEHNGIDLSGVKELPGNTFRWGGKYNEDMSVADTYKLELGVMADFQPEIPESRKDCRYVFLANAAPAVQIKMLECASSDALVVCDTIRHWIESERDAFEEVTKRSSGLILNDEEIRLLTGKTGLVSGAESVLDLGPDFVVVKKGEHGAVLVCAEGAFPVPAFPVRDVMDPTGAGDSFAGGFMGTLCRMGTADTVSLRKAVDAGIVISSINVEGIGPEATLGAKQEDIRTRLARFHELRGIP